MSGTILGRCPLSQIDSDSRGLWRRTQLAVLMQRVGTTVDHFRGGELDAFDVARSFHYSQATNHLLKFCNLGDTEPAAKIVREGPAVDWSCAGRRGSVDPWTHPGVLIGAAVIAFR